MDPEGTIQRFLEAGGIEGGANRPDISHLINRKPKTKKKSGTVIDRPKKKSPGTASKRPVEDTPSYTDDDEDEDKNDPEEEPVKEPVREPVRPVRKATPAPAPTPAPASANAPGDELYTAVLTELYDSLEGKVSNASRGKVVEHLKSRIEGISDPKKRESTVAKIAERVSIRGWVTTKFFSVFLCCIGLYLTFHLSPSVFLWTCVLVFIWIFD